MEKHPAAGGDTAWVSQYGLYDALSDHLKKFLEGLHASSYFAVAMFVFRFFHFSIKIE
jgi:hypothetical protein